MILTIGPRKIRLPVMFFGLVSGCGARASQSLRSDCALPQPKGVAGSVALPDVRIACSPLESGRRIAGADLLRPCAVPHCDALPTG